MSQANQHMEVFRQEAEELLTEIEETVLEIEENPEDIEAINKLFRTMHTIKGSGAMFGFEDISGFTHHVETILDKVRGGFIPVTQTLIDLILASRDQISSMLNASGDKSAVDQETGEQIISRLNALLPEAKESESRSAPEKASPVREEENKETTYRIRFRPDPGIFATGIDPALLMDELRGFGECVVVAQTQDVPPLDQMNPEQCYFFWDIILTTRRGINAIKDVFIFVEDQGKLTIDVIDEEGALYDASDYKRLGEILVDREDLSTGDLEAILKDKKKIGEVLVEAQKVDRQAVDSALAEQMQVRKQREKRQEATSSVRVPADKLDSLVGLVGELVTAQARLSQKALVENDAELVAISEEVERLVSGLRDNTMSIRMLQIGITFSNFKRLVRDLSKELGKEIVLTTSGGETDLDKTVIERLKDPLVHIIRNSVDHGIETPEKRKAAGKPAQGTIHLSAEHSGAHVLIKISDDGAGLDPDALRAKAIENGLIAPDTDMTKREIYQLIFKPGFSTAKVVTDVSGRGVGMDVVKRNVEALRGSIEIDSQKGVGTTFTLKLPLTLAIIDGLMVMIGKDYFILPLSSVEECVELDRKAADKIKGRNILNVRGEAVPYIRLRDQFGINGGKPNLEQIVITEVSGKRVGFVVDTVIGGHQTVIKSLGPAFKHVKDISGATILGDGTVALILDVNRLV